MLLNRLLVILKYKVVDIPLIKKYIREGRTQQEALRMYNDVVNHNTYGRLKMNHKDFNEVWEYLQWKWIM